MRTTIIMCLHDSPIGQEIYSMGEGCMVRVLASNPCTLFYFDFQGRRHSPHLAYAQEVQLL